MFYHDMVNWEAKQHNCYWNYVTFMSILIVVFCIHKLIKTLNKKTQKDISLWSVIAWIGGL